MMLDETEASSSYQVIAASSVYVSFVWALDLSDYTCPAYFILLPTARKA